jgi:hypothetical protein
MTIEELGQLARHFQQLPRPYDVVVVTSEVYATLRKGPEDLDPLGAYPAPAVAPLDWIPVEVQPTPEMARLRAVELTLDGKRVWLGIDP